MFDQSPITMDYTLNKKLQGFRHIAQEKLQNILCSIPDHQKDLIIESNLIKPLEQICGASWLRAKGINKIYKFDQNNVPEIKSTLVYFISTNMFLFKQIIDQINGIINQHKLKNIQASSTKSTSSTPTTPTASATKQHHLFSTDIKSFFIILCPNVLHSFEVLLEEEGLRGLAGLHRFNWDFLTIDNGLLSMEIPQLYEELYIRNDTSLLSSIAQSLRVFNMIVKHPKMMIAFGKHSEYIFEMLQRMEGFLDGSDTVESDFNMVLFMDRDKDYPSTLLTPVVYSGLLLELFPIKCGQLQINLENTRNQSEKLDFLQRKVSPSTGTMGTITTSSAPSSSGSSIGTDAKRNAKDIKQLILNGTIDGIYRENCYKHFIDVTNLLSAQSKALGMETQNLKDMNLIEMREYVSKQLPKVTTQKKELFKHLILCETIINELGGQFDKVQTIEESILINANKRQCLQSIHEMLAIDAHRLNALRHICLLYITCGLTTDEAKEFITDYLNTFGYDKLLIFSRLATGRLFPDICNGSSGKLVNSSSTPLNLLSKANLNNIMTRNQFQIDAQKLKLLPSLQPQQQQQPIQSQRAPGSSLEKRETNLISPSYVFNGTYIPLISQICNILLTSMNIDELAMQLQNGFQLGDALKFYKYQNAANANAITIKELSKLIKSGEHTDLFPMKPRKIFVFIVGGITYAEIAACDLIGKLTNSKIVLASNCITCGSDIIQAAFN